MRSRVRFGIAGLVISISMLAGCGNVTESEQGTLAAEVTEEINTGEESVSADTETSIQDGYTGTPYTWQEITITVPDSWKDKYEVQEDENGFSFFQKASMEKEKGMGYICGFSRFEGPVFDLPGVTPVAFTKDTMYALTVPTDVSYYLEDEAIAKEYQELASYVMAMAQSVHVDKEEVAYNPQEYELPMSDVYPLRENDLVNMNDNQLWIARNEIFARHGLTFKNEYLQEHFNSCSWYEGTVASGEIDESVLTDVEKENLAVIKDLEEIYADNYPYPVKEKIGQQIKADYAGKGVENTIIYNVENKGNDEYKLTLQIDDVVYDLADYGVYMINPEMETYYLTDISPYFDGIEIAIMDYGPSDDEVTHFFSYDGELQYLGAVGGFPFKGDSYLNGFASQGAVYGTIRTDIICTCYSRASWWYDYDNQKLVFQDTGYYQMLPTGAHELYLDLPVYTQMNTASVKKTISAQKEVYFTLTDGKEWIQVKGKDGSSGYLHFKNEKFDGLDISIEKAADVFSNLPLYD